MTIKNGSYWRSDDDPEKKTDLGGVRINKGDASHVADLYIPMHVPDQTRLVVTNDEDPHNGECVCIHRDQIPETIARLKEFYDSPENYRDYKKR